MEDGGYVDPVTGLSQEQWNEMSRPERFLSSLPDASGEVAGHLVTDACYGPDGCGPDCPVWGRGG